MSISRRSFLGSGAAVTGLLAAGRKLDGVKIGVTDWNLRMAGNVAAVSLAAQLGFEGLEVSLGRTPVDNKLPLDNAELQSTYRAASERYRIPLAGTCLDILHTNYLKNDKLGQKWVAEGIPITRNLNTKVMLLPFFGNGAIRMREEMDYVGDILKELAPAAENAGVTLALEDTISAEDNVRIMERSQSKAVKVFYDIGNSRNSGFDIVKEIRWLGRDRICAIHLKDKGYLGEGDIELAGVMRAIDDIGYRGFADLETNSPSRNIENDMRRNLAYVRKTMDEVRRG